VAESDETNNVAQFPVPLSCRQSTVCTAPPWDMRAWYPLDQTYNESVFANHAAPGVGATPAFIPAVVGAGVELDGATDFLEAPDHPALALGTGDLSIDLWVRADPGSMGIGSLLDKRTQGSGTQGFALFLQNGVLHFQLADGAGSNFCSTSSSSSCTNYSSGVHIADGEWHLVAVTLDRNVVDGGRWYVDGVEVGQRFNPTFRTGSLTTTAPLRIGVHAFFNGAFFTGGLDEIEIFRRVLSPQEIDDLYRAGPAGKCRSRIHVPWDVRFCTGDESVEVEVEVCNDGPSVQTYEISGAQGLPAGSLGGSCQQNGPQSFQVLDPPMTLQPGECGVIRLEVSWPQAIPGGGLGCFQATVTDGDGISQTDEGSIYPKNGWCTTTPGPVVSVPVGAADELIFAVQNDAEEPQVLGWMVEVFDPAMNPGIPTVALGGQRPGRPLSGEVAVSPGDTVELLIPIQVLEAVPLGYLDAVLSIDGAEGEALGSVGVRTLP
jgi:hypothetical protein